MPSGIKKRICVTGIGELKRQIWAEILLQLMKRSKAQKTPIVSRNRNGAVLDRRLRRADRNAALKIIKKDGWRQRFDGQPVRDQRFRPLPTVLASFSCRLCHVFALSAAALFGTPASSRSVRSSARTELRTRPDRDGLLTVQEFKTAERTKIEEGEGYTIIANVGDQFSDVRGDHAGLCTFKVPNPFYFIR